jgi:tetratricopeptide (TPR) repeat protein
MAQMDKVNKAYDLMKSGDAQAAKQAIDEAVANPATSSHAKAWYFKGWIYKGIFDSNKNAEIRTAAFDAVAKAISLDSEKKYTEECKKLGIYLANTIYNEGVEAYNKKMYGQGVLLFDEYTRQINRFAPEEHDAGAYFVGGMCAAQSGQNDIAKDRLQKAVQKNYNDAAVYSTLAKIHENEGNTAQAEKYINEGLKKYPTSKSLLVAQVNLNLFKGNVDAVQPSLEKAIQQEPNNVEWLLALGTVYEKKAEQENATDKKMAYIDKAKEMYRRVLAIEANNFKANFNLGIILYNSAVDIINNQSYDIDIFALDNILDQSTDFFKEALPYVEKANRLAPQDKSTLVALKAIYINLNNDAKIAEIDSKLEQMEAPDSGKGKKRK